MNDLALLEAFRPPDGYRTTAAFGTSYSADLVACLVLLSTLDQVTHDTASLPGRIHAMRALSRLEGRVVIAVQQGRILWNGSTSNPILALLDRVVRPVEWDGTTSSFHPKLLLARQEQQNSDSSRVRYVLYVGSRNLTSSTSWDLGITLEGEVRKGRMNRSTRLTELPAFVRHICRLVDRRGFPRQYLPDLSQVRWHLPDEVNALELGFLPGGGSQKTGSDDRRVSPRTLPFQLRSSRAGRPNSVLLLSPFLDNAMVSNAARVWKDAEYFRLVGGYADLVKVARRNTEALRGVNPHYLVTARQEPTTENGSSPGRAAPNEAATVDEAPEPPDLHAKVTAAWYDDGSASVLLGSPNLTSRAWNGANCEVYCLLRGSTDLADALWDWSDTAQELDFDDLPDAEPNAEEEKRLESLRNVIAATPLRFIYRGESRAGTLRALQTLPWPKLARHRITLSVSPLSAPATELRWRRNSQRLSVQPMPESAHTAFFVMRLAEGASRLSWVQHVECRPPPGEERDKLALMAYLGARGFLEYLRSLLEGGLTDAGGKPGESRGGNTPAGKTAHWALPITMEELLRRLAYHPDRLREVTETIARFRPLIDDMCASDDERALLEQFIDSWDAVAQGWSMK